MLQRINYRKEYQNWLSNKSPMQIEGLSGRFDWDWFITLTSKEVMTANGARMACSRFLGLYLSESKTKECSAFWVAEPFTQGRKGYHVHLLLDTKWPVPKERKRALDLALLLDDIYQRSMGIKCLGLDDQMRMEYRDRRGMRTNKHRFRAEPFSNARGEYCAKYVLKNDCPYEFARITNEELEVMSHSRGLVLPDEMNERELNGNLNKRLARRQTKAVKRAYEVREGQRRIILRDLLGEAHYNYAKFSKLRMNTNELQLEYSFRPEVGVRVLV